ncbi:restriction endonuclease subunit S [Flavobacterium macrobrachii]|uniref:Restriction endonuclease subunit S n=1 Tax=Flavobacterium macrobrachii TaxID=591204 RepID=A0ABS2CUI4_9FLAO|nr:restriction endonuclease subunit S [Flavobacterium macrobrachii]MBM6498628.1 restriction endonuclease subunit S [Flavobacterium macrobrachii]
MKNWPKVKLGTLLTESKVLSENPSTDNRIRVKLNVLGVEKRPVTKDKKGATKYYIRKAGQFIYGKQNLHKGAFGIIPKELDGFESSQDIPAFDVDDSCYPEWIFYFFKKGNFYLKLDGFAKGVGSKRIQPNQIYDLEIYLPNKDEQKKILNEIKKAEFKNREILNEIYLQEENLVRLRKSILKDAAEGVLTMDWRKEHPNIESADIFIQKIKLKKESLIKQKKIKQDKSTDSLITDNCDWKLNNSWTIATLNDIFSFIDYRGKTPSKSLEGKRLITAKNIRFGYIQDEPIEYVSQDVYDKYMIRGFPKNKDILFVTEGHTIGYTALVDVPFEFALAQRTICFQPYLEKMETEFFFYLFLNDQFQSIILDNQTGSAVKGIKSSKLKMIPIPIPPIDEQKIIIKKVKGLLKNCSNLNEVIRSNKENSVKLFQTILLELLGEENNKLIVENKTRRNVKKSLSRDIKYNDKTINMKLVELLKLHGKLHAEDLWKMSEYYDDKNINDSIDKFYSDLKTKIEIEKTIKEVTNEKGYIELV